MNFVKNKCVKIVIVSLLYYVYAIHINSRYYLYRIFASIIISEFLKKILPSESRHKRPINCHAYFTHVCAHLAYGTLFV